MATHGEHEERDGVPIVRKYMSDEDFKALMKFTRAGRKSLIRIRFGS